jgi:hypothetical protein
MPAVRSIDAQPTETLGRAGAPERLELNPFRQIADGLVQLGCDLSGITVSNFGDHGLIATTWD